MSKQLSKELRDWMLEYVADTMRPAQTAQIVGRINTAVIELVPELADHELQRDLAASTEAQLQAIMFGFTDDLGDVTLPPEAHGLARSIARRGLDLRVLLQIYRVGQQAAIDYLTEVIEARQLDPAFERALLLWFFERTAAWFATSVETLSDTFSRERERGFRDAFTRRSETIRALLAGDHIDVDRASLHLDYRLSRTHLAFALWDTEAETGYSGDAIGTLERVAGRIAAAAGTTRLLTAPSGARGLWGWLGVEAPLDSSALTNREAVGASRSVQVAFGNAGAGLDGFRSSHREALAARRIVETSGRHDWLTRYSDVEIASLVGADNTAMRTLVARELAGITGRDAHAARLRDTLAAYLGNHRSPEAAARHLGVHKNTVRYRMQRIEELLGHNIDSRRVQLEIALACVAAYGESVLP
ncbi:hypothetical protein FOS14_17470 [Skermania sp. ID1734]|uniref:PucR family transcriptional regulator n=1 Tax=Skermania sp. ID1734 TaxID=2597516 RepID=UPI00117F1E48|nr:helix-turn-helix domain-containing protein [Skermania sp. ID1734]TSD95599.1 hypothetical protein FOS14_17470 [Skermania sp. ID1734]